MQFGRQGSVFFAEFKGPDAEDFGILGLIVRFVINVAALWLAQLIIPGFWIDGWAALLFGTAIFGTINAFIKPIVSMVTCAITCVTLGLFMLIINTLMLALTAWIAGWLDLEFEVTGFFPAFFGALVIAIVSTILTSWATNNVLVPSRERDRDDGW